MPQFPQPHNEDSNTWISCRDAVKLNKCNEIHEWKVLNTCKVLYLVLLLTTISYIYTEFYKLLYIQEPLTPLLKCSHIWSKTWQMFNRILHNKECRIPAPCGSAEGNIGKQSATTYIGIQLQFHDSYLCL